MDSDDKAARVELSTAEESPLGRARDGNALNDTVPAPAEQVESIRMSSRPKNPTVPPEVVPVRPTIPLDRYRVGKELGRGGMGRVVEAFDTQLGRTVALKEVLANATASTQRRFAREIHITARLEHPSIVPLYDSGLNNASAPFYVMRRVSGKPLDELIAAARTLDERLRLLPAVLPAIDAVAHAHTRGVIHRDLKPANILIGEQGETVVIDWGLAKVIGEPDDRHDDDAPHPDDIDVVHTQIGSVFGTPGFMSPEQARGEALDFQGDVYALGAVLYQLLAGAPPVAGISATEVMDKTRTHDIKPLTVAAPGAPRELVAIVDKAHAFDAASRYRDAGELAEDVRRFLAGQVVAAHDYTQWQRIARFARRHRGALSVLAVAAVAGAVMSWIGVHRIVTERDAASEARREADAGKREAEEARDRLAERHDQLIVAQAKGLLERNPSEALALLKQLPSSSRRLEEARATAYSAVMRGAAYALQISNINVRWTSLDPEGHQLAVSSRDGLIRVFDLDRKQLVVAHPFAIDSRADWVIGNKLVITNHKATGQLFDPATDTVTALPNLPASSTILVASSGSHALIERSDTHKLELFDVASRTVTAVPFDDVVEDFALADDAKWIVIVGRAATVVLDRDGNERARRPGRALRVMWSRYHRFALQIDLRKVVECVLEPQPEWRDIPMPQLGDRHSVIDLMYRGRLLTMYTSNGDVWTWNGSIGYRIASIDRWSAGVQEGVDDDTLLMQTGGTLHWFNELGSGRVTIPEAVRNARIAARPNVKRVAITGDGVAFVLDLTFAIPARLKGQRSALGRFVDDNTVIQLRDDHRGWQWLDLPSGKITPLDAEVMSPDITSVDPATGRVLYGDLSPQGRVYRMVTRGQPTAERIIEGDRPWAVLVEGDAIVFGRGDGEIYGRVGKAAAKSLIVLDGAVRGAVSTGHLKFAARSNTGEIISYDLATGTIARTQVPAGSYGALATDGKGRLLVIEENRLMVWNQQLTELAKFDRSITASQPTVDGVALLVGPEHELVVMQGDVGATPRRILARAPAGFSINERGSLLAAFGAGQDITLVELPAAVSWSLPTPTLGQTPVSLSPRSRKLAQFISGTTVIWQLPTAPDDLRAWLDSQTNATIDTQGVMVWPWQAAHGP